MTFDSFSKSKRAFSSVAQSCPTLQPHEPRHTRSPCLPPTPRVYRNPSPLCQWCHPPISSSVVPFSSCPQSFPASGSFQMSQLSASDDQSTGVSASTSVPPMKTQDWSPLEWTGWISFQSKGLSRVLQHHSSKASILQHSAFFIVQLSHPYMTTGKILALTRHALPAMKPRARVRERVPMTILFGSMLHVAYPWIPDAEIFSQASLHPTPAHLSILCTCIEHFSSCLQRLRCTWTTIYWRIFKNYYG